MLKVPDVTCKFLSNSCLSPLVFRITETELIPLQLPDAYILMLILLMFSGGRFGAANEWSGSESTDGVACPDSYAGHGS